jgi:hypothetical protein
MAPANPPNSQPSPARPTAHGQRRVVPAIPLQYPRAQQRRRADTKSVSHWVPTPAKSEKSDTMSGDDGHVDHGMIQHPMTPESLASSLHRAEGSVSTSQEEGLPAPEKEPEPTGQVNGKCGYENCTWLMSSPMGLTCRRFCRLRCLYASSRSTILLSNSSVHYKWSSNDQRTIA